MEKWDNYFMGVAQLTAELSHCQRLKVGAVAVRDRRIVGCGYNGMPAGADNCCEEKVVWGGTKARENGTAWEHETVTKDEVSHAEENLITYAAKNGLRLQGTSLYITHAPCIHCAKLIRNAGFVEVVYGQLYRDRAGLDYLAKYNLPTLEWSKNEQVNYRPVKSS